ncbi:unnamed protein product [Eruca vesicaria subsp. sativa]|uniref:Uncharacterized protein n=1 Tax=Eruca vesicaria subsp. sativa TaxID=29727 RepID=A0ABC8ISR6_ERUVS|nr:unnamed protein product [Eruca vesicaria subsp. sativa]
MLRLFSRYPPTTSRICNLSCLPPNLIGANHTSARFSSSYSFSCRLEDGELLGENHGSCGRSDHPCSICLRGDLCFFSFPNNLNLVISGSTDDLNSSRDWIKSVQFYGSHGRGLSLSGIEDAKRVWGKRFSP